MSKLYENYLHLKKEEPDSENILYLFEAGIFFVFLDEDARKIAPILNLKLSNLSDKVVKCSFPVSSLEKYLGILQTTSYQIKIIHSDSHTSYSLNDYSIQTEIKNLLLELTTLDVNALSIRETYDVLNKLKEKSNQILNQN